MLVKICALGLKRIVVPRSLVAPTSASGATGSPRWYSWRCMLAVAGDGQQQVSESALTTETPTPCRPPETLYELSSNFPPECSTVMMTSAAETPFFRVDIHRDSAAVVGDGDGFVGVDGDHDAVAVAGQRLVDGVVDDLENHVVQAGAVIGVADVHAGAFAHRIKTL